MLKPFGFNKSALVMTRKKDKVLRQLAKKVRMGALQTKGLSMFALPIGFLTLLLTTAACTSIDCPLNSLVYTQYQLMNAAGKVDTLADTLTIYTNRVDGNDSVLINRNVQTTEFSLPISYAQKQDIFFFETKDTLYKTTKLDTVIVEKEDMPHFESVDCSPSFFHKITSVSCTHNAIDSIVINNHDVNYDTSKKHFLIYFKHRD